MILYHRDFVVTHTTTNPTITIADTLVSPDVFFYEDDLKVAPPRGAVIL
jgi:hypothetical protein